MGMDVGGELEAPKGRGRWLASTTHPPTHPKGSPTTKNETSHSAAPSRILSASCRSQCGAMRCSCVNCRHTTRY